MRRETEAALHTPPCAAGSMDAHAGAMAVPARTYHDCGTPQRIAERKRAAKSGPSRCF